MGNIKFFQVYPFTVNTGLALKPTTRFDQVPRLQNILFSSQIVGQTKLETGNTNLRGRLSTVDLLFKVVVL
jgi:hypothetical protein